MTQLHQVLSLEKVSKFFGVGLNKIQVLNDVSFSLNAGEIVGIVGPSGSGKSSLLNIAGLLDQKFSGEVYIERQKVKTLSEGRLAKLRGNTIGFIYQHYHLLPELNALENVMLAVELLGLSKAQGKKKAIEVLAALGLESRLKHPPSKLSGGEQQRVAIARAVVKEPKILLADEPTGSLDAANSKSVMKLFLEYLKEKSMAAIIVTHDDKIANSLDRTLIL